MSSIENSSNTTPQSDLSIRLGPDFNTVSPAASTSQPLDVIELKEDSETYLVDRDLWPILMGESTFSPVTAKCDER